VPGLCYFRKSPAKQTCRSTCSDLRSDQNHRNDSGCALTSRCSGRTNHEPSAPTTNGRSEDRPVTHCVLFPAPRPQWAGNKTQHTSSAAAQAAVVTRGPAGHRGAAVAQDCRTPLNSLS
jgi:hypothetical protein